MNKNQFSTIIAEYDSWERVSDENGNISYSFNGEHVDIEISSIGIERPSQPQARIQCQSNIESCKVEQAGDYRFFLFGVSNPTDPGTGASADKIAQYNRYKDWVVSVEGISNLAGERFDIVVSLNEAIDFFDENNLATYVRIKSESSSYQFLSVFKPYYAQNGTISYPSLESYLQIFDNRPYRTIIYNAANYIRVLGEDADTDANSTNSFYRNWLVSGAPGTGKSYMLDQKTSELLAGKTRKEWVEELVEEDLSDLSEEEKIDIANNQIENVLSQYVRRVTFYEDYAYENFVGCYKPVPEDNNVTLIEHGTDSGKIIGKKITYEFSVGPFIDVLCGAIEDREHSYILIIEEINRARAASVFGDMFLILDRDKDGESVYFVTPIAELDAYLRDRLGSKYDGKLRIPSNMYIWATMNSADQGVFYMDSAFKRRWNYTIRNVFEQRQGEDAVVTISLFYKNDIHNVLWDSFRALINKRIAEIAEEDSFIGPWYFSNNELNEIKTFLEKRQSGDFSYCSNPLVDKLFLYLRQDIFRNDPSMIFKGSKEKITMSSILNMYNNEIQVPNIDSILDFDEDEWEALFRDENTSTHEQNEVES